MTTLRCSGCKELKQSAAFNKRGDRLRGYESQCKPCKIIRRSQDAAARRRAGYRVWLAKNPVKAAAATRRWIENNPEKYKLSKRQNRLKRYGLSLADWAQLLHQQNGHCAICLTTEPGKRGWATDHNHITGEVRGILCCSCNLALGFLRDDPALAEKVVVYLRKE